MEKKIGVVAAKTPDVFIVTIDGHELALDGKSALTLAELLAVAVRRSPWKI